MSEKDRGQVHAINKGLERATGDIFAFINSDDRLSAGHVCAVMNHFAQHPESEWICGDTIMFGEGHETRMIRSEVPQSAAHCLSLGVPRAATRHTFGNGRSSRKVFRNVGTTISITTCTCDCCSQDINASICRCRWRRTGCTKSARRLPKDTGQLEEFDQIAEFYEPQLQGADQRWCRATRFLRLSYAASEAGRKSEAAKWLMRALKTHPEGLLSRPFWGCLRRVALPAGRLPNSPNNH